MPNILLVDDENELRETLAMFFELNEFNVLHAESVDQALSVFKANKVDLIISDFRMPLKTGEDLLKEVKAIDPAQNVIILTGHADIPKETLIDQGALDLLYKPIGGKELVQIAKNVIAPKRKAKREILILEDNAILLESYNDIFTLKGFQVYPTMSQKEAEEKIINKDFNTLICDYNLGAQKSLGFIKKFCKKFPDSLVIILSGDFIDESEYKSLHENSDMIHFIQKPFSIQNLIDLLGN